MTGTVGQIWRHPIKSHGRERIEAVTLEAGKAMPFDRLWALALAASKADGSVWVSCANFSRGSKMPALMAIDARLNEAAGTLTLTHPDLDPITVDPDHQSEELIDWARPLWPEGQHHPDRVVRAAAAAFVDSDFPSVTLCNFASHRAVEQKTGLVLDIRRWRGNIWIDGLAPWEEFDWIDRDVRIGDAVLHVRERTERCPVPTTNPETGRRDIDVLSVLDTWGHRDFSVRAEVVKGGRVAIGDDVERL